MTVVDNPYWSKIAPFAQPARRFFGPEGSLEIRDDDDVARLWLLRRALTMQYSWSIPDPETVVFVAEQSGGKIIDPMAGTGYWAYLLTQAGVITLASDLDPPQPGSKDNIWHRDVAQFVEVARNDAAAAVQDVDPSYTLFLSWPPMSSAAARAVQAYPGDKLIYIGEDKGGCNADDSFFDLLDEQWSVSALRHLVRWEAIRDYAGVFVRNQPAAMT